MLPKRNPGKGKEEVEGLGSDLCEWQRVYDEEQGGVRSGGLVREVVLSQMILHFESSSSLFNLDQKNLKNWNSA